MAPGRPAPSLTVGMLTATTILLLHLGQGTALQCWHCIGDDCDQDPHLLNQAKPKQCHPGEACQKVFYRVKAAKTSVLLESTTLSCSSGPCLKRNDFINCTTDNVENPGCMRLYCCNDSDMCNAAPPSWITNGHVVAAILVVFLVQDLSSLLFGGG